MAKRCCDGMTRAPKATISRAVPVARTYTTGVMNSLPVVRCNGNALANGAPSMGKAADNFTVIGVFKVASNNGWDNWIIWGNGSGDLDVYVDSSGSHHHTGAGDGVCLQRRHRGGDYECSHEPTGVPVYGRSESGDQSEVVLHLEGRGVPAGAKSDDCYRSQLLADAFPHRAGGQQPMPHGDIAELIVVNTGTNTLSVADRQRLEGYLANKWWGAGSSNPLPGHPFKSNVPLIVPPTPVMPTQGVSVTGGVVSLTFPTVAGYQYRVDYKNALTDATWQAVAPGFVTSTNGANLTVSDAGAPAQGSRFYRVEAASP